MGSTEINVDYTDGQIMNFITVKITGGYTSDFQFNGLIKITLLL